MATFFSDHMSSDGVNKTTVNPETKHSAGIGHGRLRYKRAVVSTVGASPAAALNDVIRVATFKTSDRIMRCFVSGRPATGMSSTMNIGFHKVGSALHDGAVVSATLLATGVALSAPIARVDQLATDTNRGKALWDLASLTRDPQEQWDLTLTLTGTVAGEGATLVEVEYTSGD